MLTWVLDFFVELTHDEAIAFIEKKTKLLDKKTDKLTQASTKIKANIKLVLHGLRELQGLDPNDLTPKPVYDPLS